MLLRLSDLMRSTLDRTAGQYTSLGEEVAHVARYVDLQRTRFNDRLSVVYAVDPACDPLPVPAFLLQPIVENALRHGLSPNARPGRIEIGARQDAGDLRLWVRDDGSGLPAAFDLQRDAGTGLRNISARLERIYGDHARLSLRTNEAGGTTAEVRAARRRAGRHGAGMTTFRALVAEDEPLARRMVAELLRRDPEIEHVIECADAAEARDGARARARRHRVPRHRDAGVERPRAGAGAHAAAARSSCSSPRSAATPPRRSTCSPWTTC